MGCCRARRGKSGQLNEKPTTVLLPLTNASCINQRDHYKTDHDTNPETFVQRHEMQMNWYRTALEQLTSIPVKEMWLFALRAGKAYPVRRIEVK